MLKNVIKIFVNTLTIFRCIFTFFMPMLIDRVSNLTFIIIIGILFLSDGIDGFLSRKAHVQTLFGSIMDTIADKVLCIVLIYCIAPDNIVLSVMMLGEILIATMNLIGTANRVPIASIMLGKAKMWALAIAIIVGYMYHFDICQEIYLTIFGWIVVAMQVGVLFGYGNNIRKFEEKDKNKMKFKSGKELKHALFNTEFYIETTKMSLIEKLKVNK